MRLRKGVRTVIKYIIKWNDGKPYPLRLKLYRSKSFSEMWRLRFLIFFNDSTCGGEDSSDEFYEQGKKRCKNSDKGHH